MKAVITLASCCLLCGIIALASRAADTAPAKPAAKLLFPNNGFAIAPLDQPAAGTYKMLSMSLPPSGGFAPNINVMTQEYAGTMDDYTTLTLKQFDTMKFNVLSNTKSGKDTVTLEYSGTLKTGTLHWYAKAFSKNGTVYLVTATATEDQWKNVSDKLKTCVDSFEPLAH